MNYMGIDVGGTNIKGGIIDENGNIIKKVCFRCEYQLGAEHVINTICDLIVQLSEDEKELHNRVGIALPGMIDVQNGTVIYSNNLIWKNVEIVNIISKKIGVQTVIENDASTAALGESTFGAGKEYSHNILITLGTGVGAGIIIDGRLFDEGKMHCELGHTVLVHNGEPCTCGRRGCFEAYASASALVRDTRRAMLQNPHSKMWGKISDIKMVSGKTAFEYKDVDETANSVVNRYIEMLGEGIVNIINTFRPDAVILGGGVSKEGNRLIVPLQKIVDKKVYGSTLFPNKTKVIEAVLGNDAGFVGAAVLAMNDKKDI